MAEKSPAFQFYPRDWLSDGDQAALSLQEAGAYVRMLSHAWLMVGLPNDCSKIARMIGGDDDVVNVVLREHFELRDTKTGERWFNSRQEEERKKQAKYRRQKALAGRVSGEHRRERLLNRTATEGERNRTLLSSSSSSSSSSDQTPIPQASAFDQFWSAYPRKVGKRDAQKAWAAVKGLPPVADLLAALERQKRSPQWLKGGGQFIPHPATWIRQGRWDDAPDEAPEVPAEVASFMAFWRRAFAKYQHGVVYDPGPDDAATVAQVLRSRSDERLRKLAVVLLTTDDEWISSTDRGLGILRTKITWLDERLAAYEAKHGPADLDEEDAA